MSRATNRATLAVRGVGATVRAGGFTWRATREHLGNNGVKWERFNGKWEVSLTPPPPALRRALQQATRMALAEVLS